MTVSISDLNVTEGYDATSPLLLSEMNTTMASIETDRNTYIAPNIEQIAKDGWGNANYTLNNDGNASLTNTLFNKQYTTDFYQGGDISIGTTADAAYAAVDAVNAAISFTPEIAGQYKATFTFTHVSQSTATTEFQCETTFRITDGTDASYSVFSGGKLPATASTSGRMCYPITITHIFNWTTVTTKTVTLQKYNRTMTSVNSNVVSATAATGEIYMTVEKI